MAATAKWTEDGDHVSTGHAGGDIPGIVHTPDWGPWTREYTGWMRSCLHPICDIDEYTNEKPEGVR